MKSSFSFKSQICTDIEQSKKLLSLGFNKETADMTIHLNNNSENGWYVTAEPFCEWEDDMNTLPCLEPEVIIPAWSLHRLAEMLASQWGEVMLFLPDAYDDIISDIEIEIGRGNFNKKFLV